MQISSRFTIAVHILICVDLFGKYEPATSESLAGSIGVHPVVIRRILGQLRRAGFITVVRGREGGAHIAKELRDITLADIFRAVESISGQSLFMRTRTPPAPSADISTMYSTTVSWTFKTPWRRKWRRPPSPTLSKRHGERQIYSYFVDIAYKISTIIRPHLQRRKYDT